MQPGPPRSRPAFRRLPGNLSTADFLKGVLEQTRRTLPPELQTFEAQHQGSLIKLHDGVQPGIHFELWLHQGRARIELGLHFETRNADRNRRLLDYVAEELMFLKATLGHSLEAEPWDKGWTRVYLTRPIDRLGPEQQTQLATAFAEFVATLEPLRQEAIAACP